MEDRAIFNLFIIAYFCHGNVGSLDEHGYNYFVNEYHYFKMFKDLFPENEVADQEIFHCGDRAYYKTVTYIAGNGVGEL